MPRPPPLPAMTPVTHVERQYTQVTSRPCCRFALAHLLKHCIGKAEQVVRGMVGKSGNVNPQI